MRDTHFMNMPIMIFLGFVFGGNIASIIQEKPVGIVMPILLGFIVVAYITEGIVADHFDRKARR